MAESGLPQSSPENKIPSEKPVPKTVDELQKEKEAAERKVEDELYAQQEMLSLGILQKVVREKAQIVGHIEAKERERDIAITKREEWRQDPEAYEKKQADILPLEAELKALRQKLEKLNSQEGVVRNRITYIPEKMPSGNSIPPKIFNAIIWYPNSKDGHAYEYSAQSAEAGVIFREKVAGTEDYIYKSWIENGSDAYRMVYAPGQMPPKEELNAFGKPFAPEVEKEKLSLLDILNGPQELWKERIAVALKDPEKTAELKDWAMQEFSNDAENGISPAFQKLLLTTLLREKNPMSTEVMRLWKERMNNADDNRRSMDAIQQLAKIGGASFEWALNLYEEKGGRKEGEQDMNMPNIADALLATHNPNDSERIPMLKKRLASTKNPVIHSQLLLMLCQSDPAFQEAVTSDALWAASENNESVSPAVLSMFVKRKDPRVPVLMEKIIQSKAHYQADIIAFKNVMIGAAEYIATLSEDEKKKMITACEMVKEEDAVLQPLYVKIMQMLGSDRPWQYGDLRLVELKNEEVNAELQQRMRDQEELERKIVELQKMPPEKIAAMKERNQAKQQNRPQQLLAMKNKALEEIEWTAKSRAEKDVLWLNAMRPFPEPLGMLPIPEDIWNDAKAAILESYRDFKWDDTILLEAENIKTKDQLIVRTLRQQLTPRLRKLFADGRLRKAGIDDDMLEVWVEGIAQDRGAQEAMADIIGARILAEVGDGNVQLENKMITLALAKKQKNKKEDEFVKKFGKMFAKKSDFISSVDVEQQSTYGGPIASVGTFVETVTEKIAPIASVLSPIVAKLSADKPVEKELEEETSHPLKSIMEHMHKIVEGNVQLFIGKIGEYSVLIAESGSVTHAYLEMDNGEEVLLPAPTVGGLNKVVLDHADQSTVFYDLEKENIDNPYVGDLQKKEVLKQVFAIDQRASVVTRNQIQFLSDGMHLLFRGAPEKIGNEHPLRVLGLVMQDDTVNQTRAKQFHDLFQLHMEEIRDWTFADMQALTRLWDAKGAFEFAPLAVLRGDAASDEFLS